MRTNLTHNMYIMPIRHVVRSSLYALGNKHYMYIYICILCTMHDTIHINIYINKMRGGALVHIKHTYAWSYLNFIAYVHICMCIHHSKFSLNFNLSLLIASRDSHYIIAKWFFSVLYIFEWRLSLYAMLHIESQAMVQFWKETDSDQMRKLLIPSDENDSISMIYRPNI